MNTKLTLTALFLSLGMTAGLQAEATVTIDGVHNCCKSCENGIKKAVESVKGAKLSSSTKTSATVELKSKADTKKVLAALMDGGYYGTVEGNKESAAPASASTAAKVKSATVSGVHLCCQKCANAAIEAVKSVSGVTGNTVASKAKTFEVTGEFSTADLASALNKAGFNGKIK